MRKYDELIKMSKSDDLKTLAKAYAELHMLNELAPIMNKYMINMVKKVKSIKPSHPMNIQEPIAYN